VNLRGLVIFLLGIGCVNAFGQKPVQVKPRVLVSTDIGGTDPDDNQSMAHLLMYADKFNVEGLVSSPSYGTGSKKEILRMIDLYEKDLPKLQAHAQGYPSAAYLRSVTAQGQLGPAPYEGFKKNTEGSDWIVKCARKKSDQKLWVLIWGGLEDLAQALHDAPDIQQRIKVYYIGGPNKKWGADSYAYIAANFPNLWFIEVNSSYYGFFSDGIVTDYPRDVNYYANHIKGGGYLGADFDQNHYKGKVKMGDTPSLLYLMDGNPDDPWKESWGGSFEKLSRSPRQVITRNTTLKDTVTVYSVLEFHFKGPVVNIPPDSACFTMSVKASIGEQKWNGYYQGNGNYAIKYVPKQTERLTYTITSGIPGFIPQSGAFVVDNIWPGKPRPTDFKLGKNWYTDKRDPKLFDGIWQGSKTISKWRNDVLNDWAKRWEWLRN